METTTEWESVEIFENTACCSTVNCVYENLKNETESEKNDAV